MNKLKVIGLVVGLGILTASSAMAAQFLKPEDKNGTLTLPASETHHNLYAAGGNVIINSKITGDAMLAGGMVKVVGDVEDDLTLVGGNIDVSGKVGGNLRVAGGNVSLNNTVQEDLLGAGGNIWIGENAAVTGDVVVAGGNIELQSAVGGAVKVTGGKIVINNTVNGELWVTAQNELTFGPKAKVLGKITYYGNSDPVIKDGAQLANIDRHPLQSKHMKPFGVGLLGVGIVISLLAFLAAALLLMYLLKRELTTTTDMMRNEPWANLGIGLMALILSPILFVLLLVTIVGYYIAFLVIVWYVFALMLSCLVAAVFLGRFIMGYVDKNTVGIDWKVVIVGVVAFSIIKWIPLVGWLAAFLLTVTAFGAVLRFAKQHLRRN